MGFTLKADHWIVRLIHQDNEPPTGIRKAIPIVYSRKTFLQLSTTKFLRARNFEGYHIYGRPDATQCILVDDLCIDAIDAMHKDGICTRIVVQTSKGNFQVWVMVDNSLAQGCGLDCQSQAGRTDLA